MDNNNIPLEFYRDELIQIMSKDTYTGCDRSLRQFDDLDFDTDLDVPDEDTNIEFNADTSLEADTASDANTALDSDLESLFNGDGELSDVEDILEYEDKRDALLALIDDTINKYTKIIDENKDSPTKLLFMHDLIESVLEKINTISNNTRLNNASNANITSFEKLMKECFDELINKDSSNKTLKSNFYKTILDDICEKNINNKSSFPNSYYDKNFIALIPNEQRTDYTLSLKGLPQRCETALKNHYAIRKHLSILSKYIDIFTSKREAIKKVPENTSLHNFFIKRDLSNSKKQYQKINSILKSLPRNKDSKFLSKKNQEIKDKIYPASSNNKNEKKHVSLAEDNNPSKKIKISNSHYAKSSQI